MTARPVSMMRRPMNNTPLMLKVNITGLIGEGATKAMRFEPGTTVRTALRIIAEKSNLKESDMNDLEEQFVIYRPKSEFEGTILDNYSSYLAANELSDNDVIEFKRRPYPIRVKNHVGKEETLLVDFMAPTSGIIIHICSKYGYGAPEKYRLFSQRNPETPLSPSLSLNEQDISHGSIILVKKEEKKSILSTLGSKAKGAGQSVIVRGDRIMGRGAGSNIGSSTGGSGVGASHSTATPGVPLVFGAPLASALKGQPVPPFMKQCFDYIRGRALDKEGIFRLSGSAMEIARYKEAFNRGDEPNLKDCMDHHVVCGLLKQYLRELPEPLLTFELYDTMMDNFNQPPEVLNQIITKVPEINKVVLKELLIFLSEVVAFSSSNKMPIHNVATVFAPNILRMRDENIMRIVQDTPKINTITATLILHREVFFPAGQGSGITTTTTTTTTTKTTAPASNTRVGFNTANGGTKPSPPAVSSASNINSEGGRTSVDGEYLSYVRVAYDYDSQNDQELDLREGDIVGVLQEHESGWWKGERKGVIGLFPVTYCEECTESLAEEEKLAVRDADAPAASLLALAAQELNGLTKGATANGGAGDHPSFRRGMAASEYVGPRSPQPAARPALGSRITTINMSNGNGNSPTNTTTNSTTTDKPPIDRNRKPAPPVRTKSASNIKGALNGDSTAPVNVPTGLPPSAQNKSYGNLDDTRNLNNSAPSRPSPPGSGIKKAPPPIPSAALKPALNTNARTPTTTPESATTKPAPIPKTVSAPALSVGVSDTSKTSSNNNQQFENEKSRIADLERALLMLKKELELMKSKQPATSAGGGAAENESLRVQLESERKAKEELQRSNAALLEELVKLKAAQPSGGSGIAQPAASSSPMAPPHRRRPAPLGGSGASTGNSTDKDVEAQLAEALKKLDEEVEARKAFETKILNELASLKNA